MFRLLTLGGLSLNAADRREGALRGRPQDLALLARLAVAGERGLSRDKLVGYFWPDRTERLALHSLSQALYRIRCELSTEDLFLGTRILRLNPDRLSSDVGDLERALRVRDGERAFRLYSGPFLDGVMLGSNSEFREWVEGERRRLAHAYATLVRELATAATATGDHPAAAKLWQRVVAVDPLDGHNVLELVRTLIGAGDRAGAVREARLHETLVRTELNAPPDARIRDVLASIAAADNVSPAHPPVSGAGSHAPAKRPTLAPDELCARARQCLYSVTAEAFTQGIRYARRAVQLDPDYAPGHVTLGALYIITSQVERAGDPRAQGIEHCRRAGALDPHLAEVPLWLAWAAQLDGRFREAEALALRGLSLDPDALFSHSALAWTRLNYGLATGRWEKCIESIPSFVRALEIHPRDPHMPMASASLYGLASQYDAARPLLARALEIERWLPSEMRIIGAATLLGRLWLHQGKFAEARQWFDQAMAQYTGARHVFAPYVNALTLCGLGDLERLGGRYDEAIGHYARACELLEPVPYLIGAGYLIVRLQTRLAGAFRRLRMRREEEQYAAAARETTRSREGYSFNWCWGVSEAELHYDWAVMHATCADREGTVARLHQAVRYGWKELALLDVEPSFAFLRLEPSVKAVAEESRRIPPLPEVRERTAALKTGAVPAIVTAR